MVVKHTYQTKSKLVNTFRLYTNKFLLQNKVLKNVENSPIGIDINMNISNSRVTVLKKHEACEKYYRK